MILVVFDLDGTLVDSIEDIAAAMNNVLQEYGRPPLPLSHFSSLVGGGTRNMVQRSAAAAGVDAANVDILFAEFTDDYEQNFLNKTHPFEGVYDVLSDLHFSGIQLAVLSNKSQHLVERIVATFFTDIPFTHVIGLSERFPKKPAPDALLHIIADCAAEAVLMVGDTAHDLHTAAAAGVASVAVGWGYSASTELLALNPDAYVRDVADIIPVVRSYLSESGYLLKNGRPEGHKTMELV